MAALHWDDMGCNVSVRPVDWRGPDRLALRELDPPAKGWSCSLLQCWRGSLAWRGNARVELRGHELPQEFMLWRRRVAWTSNLPCQPPR